MTVKMSNSAIHVYQTAPLSPYMQGPRPTLDLYLWLKWLLPGILALQLSPITS